MARLTDREFDLLLRLCLSEEDFRPPGLDKLLGLTEEDLKPRSRWSRLKWKIRGLFRRKAGDRDAESG